MVHWVTGAPLWTDAASQISGGDPAAMRRPALLRFASDDFMTDLMAILAAEPARLAEHRAVPVSFRERPAGAPADWFDPDTALKLYQPLHGDFNLVVASLVCARAGLPDHTVDLPGGERVAFVLRQVVSSGDMAQEFAWDAGGGRWLPVAPGAEQRTVAGEELLPMFPVGYLLGSRRRRLYAGLIPTAGSAGAAGEPGAADQAPPDAGTDGQPDPRFAAFNAAVIKPLERLQSTDPSDRLDTPLRLEASAFLLLDFADLLRQHLPAVWSALETGAPPAGYVLWLYQMLVDDGWQPWLLGAAHDWEIITGEAEGTGQLQVDLGLAPTVPASLASRIAGALNATPSAAGPAPAPVPKFDPTGEATYAVRCVYRRPRCSPCETVSAPSQEFAIAPPFDPDAPARQIRIALPVATGLKDLRRYRKNVGFLLSKQLRGQMNRVTDLKQALEGNLGQEEAGPFMTICMFSLPIITICALILMIAIVFLLNIVFFWVPFFRICLPLPIRGKS